MPQFENWTRDTTALKLLPEIVGYESSFSRLLLPDLVWNIANPLIFNMESAFSIALVALYYQYTSGFKKFRSNAAFHVQTNSSYHSLIDNFLYF